MHPYSLTYQELPRWLQEAALNNVLTLAEAAEMWDEYLLTPDGEYRELSKHLWPAAQRLHLWEAQPPEGALLQ